MNFNEAKVADTNIISFINVVSNLEWIYNPKNKIKKPEEREKKWEMLREFLKTSGIRLTMDAKQQWSSLREVYVRKHKINNRNWPYYQHMEFLNPFIKHKETSSGRNVRQNVLSQQPVVNTSVPQSGMEIVYQDSGMSSCGSMSNSSGTENIPFTSVTTERRNSFELLDMEDNETIDVIPVEADEFEELPYDWEAPTFMPSTVNSPKAQSFLAPHVSAASGIIASKAPPLITLSTDLRRPSQISMSPSSTSAGTSSTSAPQISNLCTVSTSSLLTSGLRAPLKNSSAITTSSEKSIMSSSARSFLNVSSQISSFNPVTIPTASSKSAAEIPAGLVSSSAAASLSTINPQSSFSPSAQNIFQSPDIEIPSSLLSATNDNLTSSSKHSTSMHSNINSGTKNKTAYKRGLPTAVSTRKETSTGKIAPAWDCFALRKKKKEDSLREELADSMKSANSNLAQATSKISEYIDWKQSLRKNEAKDNSAQKGNNLRLNADGFFNIIQRQFVLLSIQQQREILPKILDKMESFEEDDRI